MQEPQDYINDEELSECCGAPSLGEIHDGWGMCADCREHAEFLTEEECEECSGSGWYAAPDKQGNPEQQQCEYCLGTGEKQPTELLPIPMPKPDASNPEYD